MVYIVMAYIIMGYVVMADVVMACDVLRSRSFSFSRALARSDGPPNLRYAFISEIPFGHVSDESLPAHRLSSAILRLYQGYIKVILRLY